MGAITNRCKIRLINISILKSNNFVKPIINSKWLIVKIFSYNWFDFITAFGSALGLWTGVNLINSIENLILLLMKGCTKCKEKNKLDKRDSVVVVKSSVDDVMYMRK